MKANDRDKFSTNIHQNPCLILQKNGVGIWTSTDGKIIFNGKWNNDNKEDGEVSITDINGHLRTEKVKFGIVRTDITVRSPEGPSPPIFFESHDL